jgi:hypothetical protein
VSAHKQFPAISRTTGAAHVASMLPPGALNAGALGTGASIRGHGASTYGGGHVAGLNSSSGARTGW